MFASYQNEKTGEVFKYMKKYNENFPDKIEKNGEVFIRIWHIPPVVSHSKTDTTMYEPAPLTPLNKSKNKGMVAGVEIEHNFF